MNQYGTLGPINRCLTLLVKPPALVALIVMVGAAVTRQALLYALIVQYRIVEPESAPLISTASLMGLFLLGLAVQFQLARRLGVGGESAKPPELGVWLATSLLRAGAPWIIARLLTMTMILLGIADLPPGLSWVFLLFELAVQLALYPIVVRQASAAMGETRQTLGAIWTFVSQTQPRWSINFAVMVGVTLSTFLLVQSSLPVTPSLTFRLPSAIFSMTGEVLITLFAIATCRAMRESAPDQRSVFE